MRILNSTLQKQSFNISNKFKMPKHLKETFESDLEAIRLHEGLENAEDHAYQRLAPVTKKKMKGTLKIPNI